MPADTKRITGPESTVPYRFYSKNHLKSYEQLLSEVWIDGKRRRDSRKLNEARKLFADVGCVSQAKGSAYVELGNTKVVVSVFEPRENKQSAFDGMGDLYCEVKFAPFSTVIRSQWQPGNEEREMADAVRRALEPTVIRNLFPNFQLDIFIYVLEDDGGCLAAAINGTGLALADGEVPMYDLITALTIGIQGDLIFVDPNAEEEKLCLMNIMEERERNHGITIKAILPQLEQIAELSQHGAMTLETQLKVLSLCQSEYDHLYQYMQALLTRKCKRFSSEKLKEKLSLKCDTVNIDKLMKCMKDVNVSEST